MNLQIKGLFTLDLRSLSLLRIGIAICIITDLIIRVMDLEAHYTDRGILPLEALHKFLWHPLYFSIHAAANSFYTELIIFIFHFICAFCLLGGFKTRLFTILCWLFALSIHNRNPLIDQAGDDFLRLLLFWGIFLPWGYYYSFDSFKYEKDKEFSSSYSSFAGFAYLCQVAFLYFFSALLKTSSEWNGDFTAIYYALSIDSILTPIGKFVYGLEPLLKPLTASVFYIEFLLPFLLFVPFKIPTLRLIFIVVITSLHVGINLCLNVGLFSLISIVSLAGLLPGNIAQAIANGEKGLTKKISSFIKNKALYFKKFYNTPYHYLPKEPLIVSLFVSLILIFTVLWNVQNTGKKVLPQNTLWIAHLLRVDQYWGMFAPAVFKDDGWFVLVGKKTDGKVVDLFYNSSDIKFEKPEYVADFFKNDRWRKYHERILMVANNHFRGYYCNYLIYKWNSEHSEKLINHLEIFYMKEYTLPGYAPVVPKKELLCFCRL
jgi:hypothetical protein